MIAAGGDLMLQDGRSRERGQPAAPSSEIVDAPYRVLRRRDMTVEVTRAAKAVYLIPQDSAIKRLCFDEETQSLRPNMVLVDRQGAVVFEINELGPCSRRFGPWKLSFQPVQPPGPSSKVST